MHEVAHVDDLLAGYVFGCLEEAEAARVRAHLARCSRCALRHREYQHVGDLLALLVPPADPPPGLKEKLLSRLAA
jgi:anti-sigma factor RsiW